MRMCSFERMVIQMTSQPLVIGWTLSSRRNSGSSWVWSDIPNSTRSDTISRTENWNWVSSSCQITSLRVAPSILFRCPAGAADVSSVDYWAILQWVARPYHVGQKERRQPEAICGLPETKQYLGNRRLSDTKNWWPDRSAWKNHIHHYSRPHSRLLAGACSLRWPPQNCIYYPIQVVSVHEDAIWATGCPCNLSANNGSFNTRAVGICLHLSWRFLVTYSDSWEDHLEHLRLVLQCLQCSYLGHCWKWSR